MPDRPLAPGSIVAGKYRVDCILGEGGMGVVLGARNIQLDEPVAIKVLRPEAASDADAVARFFREARAAVRMRGVHVAKVLDVGALEDGTPYMLMERLEGADLSHVVERSGLLPVHTAVDYVLQACEALAEAHALGIVHRDIKPSNLFLTTGVDGSPCIKVLDFGISKATSAIDATRPDFGLTQTQTVMGSPQYMAPEQMRSSRRVDGRTDIWALGTIMHELITGAAPFEASTMPELFAMILQDPAPHMRARRSDVPPALDDIVFRCLEKSPDARPATVLELARLLAPFGSSLSSGAAERVARVGMNIAVISERNLAAVARANDSSRQLPVPPMLASAGIAPSAPELTHAHTMPATATGVAHEGSRTSRLTVVTIVAAIATVVIGGSTAAAVVFSRGSRPVATADAGIGARPSSEATDLPPFAIDPAPPATWKEPTPEPSSATSATGASIAGGTGASTGSASPASPPGKHPAPKGVSTTGAAASGHPAAAPVPVPSAVPVRPATTASSRYD